MRNASVVRLERLVGRQPRYDIQVSLLLKRTGSDPFVLHPAEVRCIRGLGRGPIAATLAQHSAAYLKSQRQQLHAMLG
jgi:hypothetical protein